MSHPNPNPNPPPADNPESSHDMADYDRLGDEATQTDELTAEETQSLNDYRKTDLVYKVNDYLRGKGRLISKMFGLGSQAKREMAGLDRAIAKSHTTQDLQVHRGFRLPQGQDPEKVFQPGSVYQDPGYASTALAPMVADKFSQSVSEQRAIMHINVPKGSHAYHMPRKEGEYDETEMLLGRNPAYDIQSVKKNSEGVYHVQANYRGSSPTPVKPGILEQAAAIPSKAVNALRGALSWPRPSAQSISPAGNQAATNPISPSSVAPAFGEPPRKSESSQTPPAVAPAPRGGMSPLSAAAPVAPGVAGGFAGAGSQNGLGEIFAKLKDAIDDMTDAVKELKKESRDSGPQKDGGFIPTLGQQGAKPSGGAAPLPPRTVQPLRSGGQNPGLAGALRSMLRG